MLAKALVLAVKIGSLDIVHELLEENATANAVYKGGNVLMLALKEANVAEW